MSSDYKFSFKKISIENADVHARPVLEEAKKRIGYVPNIYSMMANSANLLQTYTLADSSFRKKSLFNNSEKEIIYLTISKENACSYCVAVHSTLADTMSKVPEAITNAIREDGYISDDKYTALIDFTKIMVVSRGQPSPQDINKFISAGYSEFHILDIIHAIAIKTISNYSNHLFETPVDEIFQNRKWEDVL